MVQQTGAVDREAGMVEARLVEFRRLEPVEQQVIAELLADHPLAANCIQRH